MASTCSGAPAAMCAVLRRLRLTRAGGLIGLSDYIDALGVHALRDKTPSPVNFPIDVTLISGRFELVDLNGTPTPEEKDPTESEYQTPEVRDYNDDGTDDHVSELGALTEQFIKDINDEDRAKLYGVWFNKPDDVKVGAGGVLLDAQDEPIAPDLVRVADREPNFEPIGLVEQISEEDMLESDLYVFRESTGEVDVSSRPINIQLPNIKLYPPNLRIQVERHYQVDKGLTAGQTRNYRVGSEGAALASDQFVAIHTQWLDQDGTALPCELPGYTGRLVNLVADRVV